MNPKMVEESAIVHSAGVTVIDFHSYRLLGIPNNLFFL